jgi:hypothetical protein
MHTEIVADSFRDKIFDTEIIVALVRALGDKDASVRISVAQIFTAALAQGALRRSREIFMLKHSQRAFGTI